VSTQFNFRVSDEVFEQFPDYFVGWVFARNLQMTDSDERIRDLLADAEFRAGATYAGQDLKTLEPFAAWRDAFSFAGWSPSRFPASVEALHPRIQRGDTLPRINPAVDLANATVLFYSVPIGTHDGANPESELAVRHARPGDAFQAHDGSVESPDDGEIVYACGADVRTRRWVWRQSRSALLAPTATEVFYPIDGFQHRTLNGAEAAMNFLREMCEALFGADVQCGMVSAAKTSIELRSIA
jgi:DNA/RNA-binding domain of Phe-tRNA-synthetase-like protein